LNKNVVIHVGMPKTATTFLQAALFPQIPDAFYYDKDPELGRLIFNMPFSHPHFTDLAPYRACIERVARERPERTMLISHESLSGHPWFNFENHENDAATLRALFPDAKILVTIRRQDTFLESLYSHSIHMGFAQPLDRFLNYRDGEFDKYHYNRGLNVDVGRLDLSYLVGVYEQLFGRANVLVLPYEMIAKQRAEFLERFFAFSGCEPVTPDWDLTERMPQVIGRSLSNRTSRLARALNPLFKTVESNGFGFFPRTYLLRALYRFDRSFAKPGQWLDAELAARIVRMHSQSNAELGRRYDLGLDRYGYHAADAAAELAAARRVGASGVAAE
jgi:hypothetical protein